MRMIALDVETTGIEPGSRLTQIGLVFEAPQTLTQDDLQKLKPGISSQDTLTYGLQVDIDPSMPIPPDITKLNGFDDARARKAPVTEVALSRLAETETLRLQEGAEDEILVMHNAPFDCAMLLWSAERVGVLLPDYLVIDTLEIAKALGVTKKNSLDALISHYGIELRHGPRHSAVGDAGATLDYFNIVWPDVCTLFEPKTLRQHAAVHGYRYTSDMPPGFEGLPACVEVGAPFAFAYNDEKEQRTERSITPYGWALREVDGEERFYFHGYCWTRNARRTFRADRAEPIGAAS